MPRLYENQDVDRAQYYESYLETYISRDIKNLSQVADEVGVSAPTAKHWLSILVSSGIVALIQPYSNNALKRVIKAPRMYFLDTVLCAHLTKWSSSDTLEAGTILGQEGLR